jgi:hypothetical protein
MSAQTPQSSSSRWRPASDHQHVLDGLYIEVAEQELRTDGLSLRDMRIALAAVIYDKRVRDKLMPIMPTLHELEFALAMAAEGERHPAFNVKKKPHGGRGYTAVQRGLWKQC